MGKVFSNFVKRPLRNINVEERAFKAIEKNEATRPSAAPRHESTKAQMEQFQKERPDLLEEQKQKSDKLHDMLKGMVVNPDKVNEIIHRPLPEKGVKFDDPEYGYAEPERIPEGKASLRQAMEFINNTFTNPEKNTSQHIAQEYKLDQTTVENILKHFQVLQIQLPKITGDSATATSAQKLLNMKTLKGITSGKKEDSS